MNENLNLVEILKDCPKGTRLYSPIVGDVELDGINHSSTFYPIELVSCYERQKIILTRDGLLYVTQENGECMLFPSKDQRDWSKFKPKKPKFDPATLQPFDKILVRDDNHDYWSCSLFSYTGGDYGHICSDSCSWKRVIPYNEDTKYLVGTSNEAPEYYRYWEE